MKTYHSPLLPIIALALCAIGFASNARAQLSWIGLTYVVLSEDLGSRQWYDAGASTANPDFQGRVFTNMLGRTLHIGGQAQTYAPIYGTTVTLFWRMREETSPGVYTTVSSGNFPLPYRNQQGNNDRWEQHPVPGQTPGSTNHNVNVLSGLGVGQYQFQVWYRAQNGGTTVWDNNAGANYTATIHVIADPDMPMPGHVTVYPPDPRENDLIIIRYRATDGPLADAGQIVLFIGRNGWLNPVHVPMTYIGDGVWEAVYALRRLTGSLQWAFHDNAPEETRRWDNNWVENWQARVWPTDSGGDIQITNPLWDTGWPNGRRTIELRGRATGIDGELHWINESNGAQGWIGATPEWSVPGLPLADGENVIRVAGMTSTRSPNHGARDCATNMLYRNDGWQWRQNGGTGWGEWALNTVGSGGFFIGDASTSTNLVSHPYAWGLYSGSSGEAHAIRRLGSTLRVGEIIRLTFENNDVQSGGSVGITLRDGQDQRIFTFYFEGGQANYLINDTVTAFDTGIPWRDTGMVLTFQLTSPTNYRFTVDGVEFNRVLNPTPDGLVRSLRIWNSNAGSGGHRNLFVADLSVTGPDLTPVEISAERVIFRQPGAPFRAELIGNELRAEVLETDAAYEYDILTRTDLVEGEWVPAGLRVRGDGGVKSFILSQTSSTVFVRAVGVPVIRWEIDNPYQSVRWDDYERHKAALHVHTTMSDGGGTPAAVIDRYVELGYSIIAITDHDTMGPGGNGSHPNRNRTTWPWEAFGRVPEALNVLAIEANEISNMSDFGSFFNNYGDGSETSQETALEQVAARGGLAVLFHPGRYLDGSNPSRTIGWYVQTFRNYDHVVGIEVYNQIDRYPNDRAAWDALLTQLIDERPVWGYANDDMHSMSSQLGYNWNVMLMPELSEDWMRHAMTEGTFFWVHSPHAHNGPPPPTVHSISVDRENGVIAIQATGHARIDWISDGAVVHQGDQIDLDDVAGLGSYVRAVIYAADSSALVGTQPFRVSRVE